MHRILKSNSLNKLAIAQRYLTFVCGFSINFIMPDISVCALNRGGLIPNHHPCLGQAMGWEKAETFSLFIVLQIKEFASEHTCSTTIIADCISANKWCYKYVKLVL